MEVGVVVSLTVVVQRPHIAQSTLHFIEIGFEPGKFEIFLLADLSDELKHILPVPQQHRLDLVPDFFLEGSVLLPDILLALIDLIPDLIFQQQVELVESIVFRLVQELVDAVRQLHQHSLVLFLQLLECDDLMIPVLPQQPASRTNVGLVGETKELQQLPVDFALLL